MQNPLRIVRLLVLAAAATAATSGCAQIPYGWKQELELVREIPRSFAGCFENENDQLGSAYGVGLRADLHDFEPISNSSRGASADWYRLTTP